MRILTEVVFGFFLLAISIQDVRTGRLKLWVMLMGSLGIFLLRAIFEKKEYLFSTDLLLSAVCGGFFLAISWLGHEKIGFADSIAIAGIFLCCGYETGMIMVFMSFFLAGVSAIVLLLAGKIQKEGAIPFLPFLFAGYLGGIILII